LLEKYQQLTAGLLAWGQTAPLPGCPREDYAVEETMALELPQQDFHPAPRSLHSLWHQGIQGEKHQFLEEQGAFF
jgi:hypothetical protein